MTDEQSVQAAAPTGGDVQCSLCGVALSAGSALSVSGHVACERCVAQLQDEVAAKQAGAASLPLAVVGTLVGALVAAVVWAGIAIATDYEIGYVAILVGFLAGKGAVIATGGAHGRTLQVIAVAGSVIGLLLAKYAIFAHEVKTYVLEEYGEAIGYLDTRTMQLFTEALTEMTSLFDLLWIALAVGAAWRVPASPELEIGRA